MRSNKLNISSIAALARAQDREQRAAHRLAAAVGRAPQGAEARKAPINPPAEKLERAQACMFAGIDAELVRSKPLVTAIAREICKLHGGNPVLNWLEAEILLDHALSNFPDHRGELRHSEDAGQ